MVHREGKGREGDPPAVCLFGLVESGDGAGCKEQPVEVNPYSLFWREAKGKSGKKERKKGLAGGRR